MYTFLNNLKVLQVDTEKTLPLRGQMSLFNYAYQKLVLSSWYIKLLHFVSKHRIKVI